MKKKKICKNVGVKGEYLRRKANKYFLFFELRTKKAIRIFCLENHKFSGKLEFFFGSNRKFLGRIHDPQTSNQIDTAVCK